MDGFLRFTPDEYRAITGAFAPGHLRGGYRAFQLALAAALSPGHPAVAARIAGLSLRKARTLREHLRGHEAGGLPPAPQRDDAPALSFEEWRAVSDAWAVVWLRGEWPDGFTEALAGEAGRASPALAERLALLGEGEAAALCRRLKSGRRFCF